MDGVGRSNDPKFYNSTVVICGWDLFESTYWQQLSSC